MSGFGYRNLGFGAAAPADDGAFDISNSVRLDGQSAYFDRTPSASNRRTWTLSLWVKRSEIGQADVGGDRQRIFSQYTSSSDVHEFIITGSGRLLWNDYVSGNRLLLVTTALLRDPSAWYHLMITLDTTQGTASNRAKIFINGIQVTSFSETAVYPTENQELKVNTNTAHNLGRQPQFGADQNFDGYMTEVHFVDGAQLTPSTFGETGDYGEWKAKLVEGVTYGGQGWFLDFKLATASATGIGADQSGNGNNWTPAGIAATDQMLDSPTNNFPTINPNVTHPKKRNAQDTVLTEGNLRAGNATANLRAWEGTQRMVGKCYWEAHVADINYQIIGFGTGRGKGDEIWHGESNVATGSGGINLTPGGGGEHVVWNEGGGASPENSGANAFTAADNDVYGFAYDETSGKAWVAINNTWFDSGDPANGTGEVVVFVAAIRDDMFPAGNNYQALCALNFGQDSSFAGGRTAQNNTDANGIGDFFYAPPAGFLAMCTKNLPAAIVPQEQFQTVVYTGNGGADRGITGVGFQPDLVWLKARSATTHHGLFDAIRGKDARLLPCENAVQDSQPMLESFDADGFTTGDHHNADTISHLSWNWKGGGTTLGTGAFTQGSIPSTCNRNAAGGFSIVSYTGTGSNGTVGHGLSQAPGLVVVKRLSGATGSWAVGSDAMSSWAFSMEWDTSDAQAEVASRFNSTTPTATVFYIGTSGFTNTDDAPFIAYCWHNVEAYSRIGSFEGLSGDSANESFNYTGFAPAWLMIKDMDGGGNWVIYDNVRNVDNPHVGAVRANIHDAEVSTATLAVDFLSNGFKVRGTSGAVSSEETYLFVAYAAVPFKHSAGQ